MDSPHIAYAGTVVPRAEEAEFPVMSKASAHLQSALLASLRREGFTVDTIVSVRQEAPFPRGRFWLRAKHQAAEDGPLHQLSFVNIVPLKTLWLAAGSFLALLRWGLKFRSSPRVILLYNLYPIPAAACLAAARLTGARIAGIVADLHVPGSGMRPGGLLHRIDFRLQTWAMPRLDGLVVLSTRMASDFAPRTPSIHLEGGAEDWMSPSTDRDHSGELPIVYAGNLSPFRGVPMLLEAFAKLTDSRYRLWIAGHGEVENDVRRAAAADPRITYFGVLNRDGLAELYAKAAVLVNPLRTHYHSARYLFPSKVLEYMVSGTPVISTAHVDFDDGYRSHLHILEEETPEALARLMERVCSMPRDERAAFGARARAFALEFKSWTLQGQRLAAFLREILSRHS